MQIPGYTIEREIGRGGMSTVYLAVQESLGRKVALKVMSAALASDRTFSERFLKEARTIALFSHPHIVGIHDVGVADHDHYLALEYIGGGDLKSRIRRGPISPDTALGIVREIASALGYAHAKIVDGKQGIVHRDIKPENILFRDNGMAVLTDFGIARAVGGGTRMTGVGMSIGTPHYMSPEQARGKDVDGRADLYALGIVLYEMLTGKVPYDAEETLAIGIKHVTEPVPVLPASLAGYQSLIDRMLAKEPDDRYRSGEALIAAIENHDPKARPRPSALRPTVVMPAVPSMPAANTPPTTAIGAVKGAMIGGAVAVGVLAAAYGFFGYQNQTPPVRSTGANTASSENPRTTDLQKELEKTRPEEAPKPAKQAAVHKTAPPTLPVPKTKTPAVEADPAKVELAAWNIAQAKNTRNSYQSFIETYPSGAFAQLARARMSKETSSSAPANDEASDWRAAEQSNSRGGYERFVSAYPNSAFAKLARTRIEKLQ